MQTKILISVLVSLSIISINSYTLGNTCNNKTILTSSGSLYYDDILDHKEAFNKISSCASLRSSQNTSCCYIKVKFRNRAADKKYTHRGCIEVSGTEWSDIDSFIANTRNRINTTNIDKVDVDVDCNSKFIKLTALVLLAFLL